MATGAPKKVDTVSTKAFSTEQLFGLISSKMVDAYKAQSISTEAGDITLEEIFSKEAAALFDAKEPALKVTMIRDLGNTIRGLLIAESTCFTPADKMIIARKLKHWIASNEALVNAEIASEGATFEDGETAVLEGTLALNFIDQADKILAIMTKLSAKHELVIKCEAIGYESDVANEDFTVAPLLDGTANVTKNVTKILKGIGVIYSGLEKRDLITPKLDKHMDALVKLVLDEVNKESFTKEQHRLALQGRFQITEKASKKAKVSVEKKQGFASRVMHDAAETLRILALEVPRELLTIPKATTKQRVDNLSRQHRTAMASNIFRAIIA